MQFTIRDALFLLTIVGLSLGWWIDRQALKAESRKWESENARLRVDSFKLATRLIGLEVFPQATKRIRDIYDAAKQSPPSPEAAAEILHYVRNDPDYRIRMYAMAVCPLLNERKETINTLLEALRERDAKKTGDGIVPCYAATYLAEMKATNATGDIKAWLDFLKQDSPYDPEVTPILIKSAEKRLAQLIASAKSDNADHRR